MRAVVSSFAAGHTARDGSGWPLPNVWLGVSVENQHFADERIPLLLQTPAAVRFISAEPLLGPVDLDQFVWPACIVTREQHDADHGGGMWCDERCLDWVIVGGESGHGARSFDLAWARSIVSQCRAAGVPVFVKQLGARPLFHDGGGRTSEGLRHPKGGDPTEWPEDLRVREFPAWELPK
jgi:protein gp37